MSYGVPVMSAPNVLLVVFDTARRDTMEPFGAPPGSTPAIADLARRGHAYQHGYANCSWTLPSHASMFTGLLPRHLGLTQSPESGMPGVRAVLQSQRDRLLPAVLSNHGYETRAWVTNLWVSRHAGFDIGFDSLEYVDSGRHQAMEVLLGGGPRAKLAWAREGLRSAADDGAREVAGKLTASIRGWNGTPTFWFVNLTECHSPYLPPHPWNDLPPWDRARAALDLQRHLNFLSICLYACGRRDISPGAMERMQHLYRRAVSYMDDWLARVLGALEERGILDETLVILTSDHGENFGEQGLLAHGFSLDQRLINVPLVMAGPGTPEPDEVISLAAIPRLVTAATGIAEAPYQPDELPAGVAVGQYDPMAPIESPKISEFAEQHGLSDDELGPICASFTSVTDGRFKLLLRDGKEQFYDLQDDPGEERPLGATAAEAYRLREALGHPALTDSVVEPVPANDQAAPTQDEVEAIERQMRLLGYM
jgi:arylsulfatase A-like enzyme